MKPYLTGAALMFVLLTTGTTVLIAMFNSDGPASWVRLICFVGFAMICFEWGRLFQRHRETDEPPKVLEERVGE